MARPKSHSWLPSTYTTLAVLSARDFRQLLRKYPDIRAHIADLAAQREATDRQVRAEGPPPEAPWPA